MKKRPIAFLLAAVLVASVLLLVIIAGLLSHRQQVLREVLWTSDANHANFIVAEIQMYGFEKPTNQLPHEPGVAGWAMFARFCSRTRGGLNCNHGAPPRFPITSGWWRGQAMSASRGYRFGGWQAVNLPPEKWQALRALYGDHDIPFAWCGKPTGQGQRYIFRAFWARTTLTDDTTRQTTIKKGWSISRDVISEADLPALVATLNQNLAKLGEPAVPLDVPDNVNWEQYRFRDQKP